ncbi:hypothetical protein ACFPH6_26130 [Streptomyces xiangluensis]|uniref:Uncharacterized protein n=1 Tax=Streptomyces xiangluensis TaxID=2665720 RepID=A0ABV8YV73_9ACTN
MDARQARRLHEDRLMGLAHVTGVGIGRDEDSGEDVIVVFVTHKVPRDRLRPEDVIPDELEGVPVRVLPMGDGETQDDTQDDTQSETKTGTKGEAQGETEQEQTQRGS